MIVFVMKGVGVSPVEQGQAWDGEQWEGGEDKDWKMDYKGLGLFFGYVGA